MTKSMYFQHDYTASNDYKILYLRQQLGIEGYGIYWYIVEQLAQSSSGKLPLRIIPVLAMQIQTTPDKVNSVIKNYDLFVIENDDFFSSRLMKQLDYRSFLQEAGRVGGLKSAEARKNKQIEPPLEGGLQAIKKERKKESKEIKEIITLNSLVSDFKKQNPGKYSEGLYSEFLSYWQEKNKSGIERWQSEKFFEIPRRLSTWHKNQNRFERKQKPNGNGGVII